MDPNSGLHGDQTGFGAFVGVAGSPFEATYKSYSPDELDVLAAMYSSVTQADSSQVEKGGKIVMPQSALEALTRLHIEYPMLFRLTCQQTQRATHSGVLEFTSRDGTQSLRYAQRNFQR